MHSAGQQGTVPLDVWTSPKHEKRKEKASFLLLQFGAKGRFPLPKVLVADQVQFEQSVLILRLHPFGADRHRQRYLAAKGTRCSLALYPGRRVDVFANASPQLEDLLIKQCHLQAVTSKSGQLAADDDEVIRLENVCDGKKRRFFYGNGSGFLLRFSFSRFLYLRHDFLGRCLCRRSGVLAEHDQILPKVGVQYLIHLAQCLPGLLLVDA